VIWRFAGSLYRIVDVFNYGNTELKFSFRDSVIYNVLRMPIFEYVCEDCEQNFEALIIHHEDVKCPGCNSAHLSKQYSRFGMGKGASNGAGESLPLYKGGGCGCTPSSCGCKN
jgi:putative FmdB family regulatory protein